METGRHTNKKKEVCPVIQDIRQSERNTGTGVGKMSPSQTSKYIRNQNIWIEKYISLNINLKVIFLIKLHRLSGEIKLIRRRSEIIKILTFLLLPWADCNQLGENYKYTITGRH